jgi:hypothetical protein
MNDKELAVRSGRPRSVPRRALFMPVWHRLVPGLARLAPQQANEEVNSAYFDATQTLPYKLTLLLAVLSLPAIFILAKLPAYWCIVPAMSTSVVQWWLAARQMKRRLPELLAARVEVGEV